ncbi:hypothetical protein M407DRAFT_231025, partial [Tulasnella calospora MUT 4182]
FAELCFLCGQWFTNAETWTGHSITLGSDLDASASVQSFQLRRMPCLTWILPLVLGRRHDTPPTTRMRQFLDRSKWQDHNLVAGGFDKRLYRRRDLF